MKVKPHKLVFYQYFQNPVMLTLTLTLTRNPEETMVILTFTLNPFRVPVNYTYS